MSSLIDSVAFMNFDELRNLAESEFDWSENSSLHAAIMDRYEELWPEDPNVRFGNDPFWGFLLELESLDIEDDPLDSDDEDEPQIGGALNLDDHLEIRTRENVRVKKFNITATGLELRFKNLDRVNDISELLTRALETALERTFQEAEPEDKVGVEVIIPALESPVLVPFTTKDQLTVENILHLISQVLQSNAEIKLDDGLLMRTTRVQLPRAGGRRDPPFRSNIKEFLKQKGGGHGSSLIEIQNSDHLCVFRAIVLGISRHEKDESPENLRLYENVRKGDKARCTKQKTMAMELATKAGVHMDRSCTSKDFRRIQTAMKDDYRLMVYSTDHDLAKIFEGPQSRSKIIRLLIHEDHAFLITSMAGLFAKSYWCDSCDKGFDQKTKHKCDSICSGCKSVPPCPVPPNHRNIDCDGCGRFFTSKQCFDNHKSSWSGEGAKRRRVTPLCERLIYCQECRLLVPREHKCGYTTCHICQVDYKKKTGHLCYMPTYTKSEAASKRLGTFIFFDMESIVGEKIVGQNDYGDIMSHEVNCVCSVKVCRDCVSTPDQECGSCGTPQQKIRKFFGDDSLADFCQYLFSPQNRHCTALAHNLRSYDGILLMKYLDSQPVEPKVLTKGRQILCLEVDKIRCVDTLNFIPMKLANMGKAFGISETKGHFPYFYNKRENYDAVLDQLPDVSYFDPANRSTKDRDDIYRWHATENARLRATGEKWVFKDELIKYCMMDTVLLAKAGFKFRNDMLDRTGICPFTESVTIASACNLHFRKNHLTEGQIGLCPEGGYRREDRQSMFAIRVLKMMAEEEKLSSQDRMIKHCLNGGEVKIDGYKVDGLLCVASTGEELKEVYEIHGCAYHGCEICYPRERDKIGPGGISMKDAFERTRVKDCAIRRAGYNLNTIWEHQIRDRLKCDPEFKARFDSYTEIQDPLDPRDAFYGGRVGALEMYRKVQPGEKIEYLDVISLYPFVNRSCAYPTGHPVLITEDFLPISTTEHPYEGLMKVTILPPRGLRHPVLPYRRHDTRLIFGLCRSCIDSKETGRCTHSIEERAMTGTWVSVEIYKALDMGYEILKVFEVYHYDAMKEFDGNDPKTGLFSSYIGWAMKMKIEASGYPSGVETEEQKEQYVADYLENEGIELDPTKIEFNPSLRSLGKLMANSFWGKLGQSSSKQSTQEYFMDLTRFFALASDPTISIQYIRICSEEKVCVTYRSQDNFRENPTYVSVPHAVYTTAYARLVLYSYLEKLGERVLYYDTDSCVFLSGTSPNEYRPEIGRFLGDMSSEFDCYGPGSYCTEFVAGGPKEYTMKIWSTKENKYVYLIKIKGFTLNSITSKQLNFKTLKKKVGQYLRSLRDPDVDQNPISIVTPRIGRDKDHNITSFLQHKNYSVGSDKFVILKKGKTRPYGFV